MRVALALLLLTAAPALAEPPPLDFFAGRYRVIGIDAGKPPALVDGDLRLEPDGAGLKTTVCGGTEGRLDISVTSEIENVMTGNIGNWLVWCMYYSDGDNYPILNCGSEDGVRVTLWPDRARFDQPLRCDPDAGGGTRVGG